MNSPPFIAPNTITALFASSVMTILESVLKLAIVCFCVFMCLNANIIIKFTQKSTAYDYFKERSADC